MRIVVRRSRTAFVAATVLASLLLVGATVGTVAAGGGCTVQVNGITNLAVTAGMVACGGSGDDSVAFVDVGGTFNGGAGNDTVGDLYGTFNGGSGQDHVLNMYGGTFDGASGADSVTNLYDGYFDGRAGDDHVDYMSGGTFDGGPGTNTVTTQNGGTFNP
jgi:hypothetical protein